MIADVLRTLELILRLQVLEVTLREQIDGLQNSWSNASRSRSKIEDPFSKYCLNSGGRCKDKVLVGPIN